MKVPTGWFLAVAMTVAAALVNGVYTGRWGEPADLSSAASVVDRLPMQVGDWRAIDEGERLTETIQEELGLVNHLNRIYENAVTGRRVQLLLMAGRPGPLVRHPPTVCYSNRAHEQLGEDRWVNLSEEDAAGRFRLLTYRPARSQAGERFYVAYAHHIGVEWDVPTSPRLTYGAAPSLHKAQVLLNLEGGESEPKALEELSDFVRQFSTAFDTTAKADAA